MRIASRFAIAVHILTLIGMDESTHPSSESMAGSIGVNAVIVRNVTAMLRRADLVATHQGVAGAHVTRPLSEITLLDVYQAAETDGNLFAIHPNPNPDCTVGAQIQSTLEHVFQDAQSAMEQRFAAVTIADIVQGMQIPTV